MSIMAIPRALGLAILRLRFFDVERDLENLGKDDVLNADRTSTRCAELHV